MVLKRAPNQWRNGERVEELQERWIRTYNLIAQHKMLDEVNRAQLKAGSSWGGGSDPGSGPDEGSSDAGPATAAGGQMTTGQV